MKSTIYFALLNWFVLSACVQSKKIQEDRFDQLFSGNLTIIDLTYTLNQKNPHWPGSDTSPFIYDTLAAHKSGAPALGAYRTPEHFGTHLDAPAHFADGQPSVDQLAVSDLFGPAVVVNVVEKCTENPDYVLTRQDLEVWESEYGEIPEGAIVLMQTGWGEKWNDMKAYRNMDSSGKMHFPGFSAEAARFLIDVRNISGIGIDNLSVDAGAADGFPAHDIVNGAGKYHLENVADLNLLPPVGAFLIVAPIKLEGGSGGQVRIFAVLP